MAVFTKTSTILLQYGQYFFFICDNYFLRATKSAIFIARRK